MVAIKVIPSFRARLKIGEKKTFSTKIKKQQLHYYHFDLFVITIEFSTINSLIDGVFILA